MSVYSNYCRCNDVYNSVGKQLLLFRLSQVKVPHKPFVLYKLLKWLENDSAFQATVLNALCWEQMFCLWTLCYFEWCAYLWTVLRPNAVRQPADSTIFSCSTKRGDILLWASGSHCFRFFFCALRMSKYRPQFGVMSGPRSPTPVPVMNWWQIKYQNRWLSYSLTHIYVSNMKGTCGINLMDNAMWTPLFYLSDC